MDECGCKGDRNAARSFTKLMFDWKIEEVCKRCRKRAEKERRAVAL